jgi:hypothetical protein
MSELLSDARRKPELLVPAEGKDLASFTISLARPMGLKRGTGRRSFIDSILGVVDEFYGDVVQRLKVWQPKAPKLERPQPELPTSPPDTPAPASNAAVQPVTTDEPTEGDASRSRALRDTDSDGTDS